MVYFQNILLFISFVDSLNIIIIPTFNFWGDHTTSYNLKQNTHSELGKWLYLWNLSEQQQSRYFNSGYRNAFGLLLLHSDLKKKSFGEKAPHRPNNTPPVMYASGIYVTGLVPCLVNAVDFLLYELHISELQSPVIYPVCTPWNSIFKCISCAQKINITPT